MIWEGEKYPWSDMSNRQRKEMLVHEVFPAYHEQFVSLEPARLKIERDYGVAGDLFACSDPRVGTDFFGVHDGELYLKRAIGGRFDLGHPTLRAKLSRVLDASAASGYAHIIFVSYHFSKTHGKECAGHDHDNNKAKVYGQSLFREMKDTFSGKGRVYVIMCGMDTDTGEVILFAYDGSPIHCPALAREKDEDAYKALFFAFPGFPRKVLIYLLDRIVRGNGKYVRETRPPDLEVLCSHNEFSVGYGEGFFPIPRGRVMVVNPFINPFSDESPLAAALKIQAGLQRDRVIKNGFLMTSGAVYAKSNEEGWARRESLYNLGVAMELINSRFPDLVDLAMPFPLIMDRETRKITVLELP